MYEKYNNKNNNCIANDVESLMPSKNGFSDKSPIIDDESTKLVRDNKDNDNENSVDTDDGDDTNCFNNKSRNRIDSGLALDESYFDDEQRSTLLIETTPSTATTTPLKTITTETTAETCLTTTEPTKTTISNCNTTTEAIEVEDINSIPLVDEEKALNRKEWCQVYEFNENSRGKRNSKFERRNRFLISFALLFLLLILVVFIILFYEMMKQKGEQNQVDIDYLESKVSYINKKLNRMNKLTTTTLKPPAMPRARKTGNVFLKMANHRETTMIKLVGDGGVETSQSGKPIHSWAKLLKRGNITFYHGRVVKIKIEGLYMLQARMYFKDNNNYKGNHLDFGVVKRSSGRKEAFILATTVPKKHCGEACSAFITEMVYLKIGDRLSIQTKSDGQSFGMFGDRSSFALYLF